MTDPAEDEALARYEEQLEAGLHPDREALVAQYPGLAAELGFLDKMRNVSVAFRDRTALPGSLPEIDPGDFEPLGEIGRGGMGVVYRARQRSLGRIVALKVLPDTLALDDHQRLRFRQEAEVTASLESPHILPVYGMGQDKGHFFFAMKFVDGPSLHQVLQRVRPGAASAPDGPAPDDAAADPLSLPGDPRSPAWVRLAAGWVRQAAEGLATAHHLDVVHRDVKPANLILTRQGHLYVADFGLARVRDLTLGTGGRTPGTPRYLAPERALGEAPAADPRGDVYALGVTLYELLTLAHPFDAPDDDAFRARLAQGEPLPPHRRNPGVSPELEAVVLKAMARLPADRYPTARELADDLDAFLHDRPVTARLPGPGLRLRRWARPRRRPLTLGATALVVGAFLGLTAAALYWWYQSRQLTHARHELAGRLLASSDKYQGPEGEAFREEMATLARLADPGTAPREFRQETARSELERGHLHARIGEHDRAESLFTSALARLDPLVDEQPDDPRGRLDRARVLRKLAEEHAFRRQFEAAEGRLLRALQDLDHAATLRPGVASVITLRNELRLQLMATREWQGHAVDGVPVYEEVLRDDGQLADIYSKQPLSHIRLALHFAGYSEHLWEQGRLDEAEAAMRRACEADAMLKTLPGSDYKVRFQTMSQRGHLARRLHARGKADEAARLLDDALAELADAAQVWPAEPQYRVERAVLLVDRGHVDWLAGRTAEAGAAYRRALDLFRQLPPGPARTDGLSQLACVPVDLLGPAAWADLAHDVEATQNAGTQRPLYLGAVLVRAGLPARARPHLEQAARTAFHSDRRNLARLFLVLAEARQGHTAEARRLLADADTALAQSPPSVPVRLWRAEITRLLP